MVCGPAGAAASGLGAVGVSESARQGGSGTGMALSQESRCF